MKEEKIKCERCLRVRDVFQWTHFEQDRWVEQVEKIQNSNGVRYEVRKLNLANRRGLCEECAVEVNKKKYDERGRYSDEMKDNFVTELSREEEDKFYKKAFKTKLL